MPIDIDKLRLWSYNRQYLGKQGNEIQQVLSDIIGVYSNHPTAPLSLHARVKSMSAENFFHLDNKKKGLRIPAMRHSVYLLAAESALRIKAATVPPASDPFWEKRYSQKGRSIPREHYIKWKEQVIKLTDSPLLAKEIKERSGIPDEMVKVVLNRMAFEGHLLRVGAKSLRSNIISYVASGAWITDSSKHIKPDDALAWLAGEYLRAFGPVRIKDFQWWTGVGAEKAKTAFSNHNTVFIYDDYLLPEKDLPAFESLQSDDTDNIDLLPQWDNYLMGYAPDGRERFVSPDTRDQIYGKLGATGGNALGTVLVNGYTCGSWNPQFKGNQMHVTLRIFEKPGPRLSNALKNQFEEMAAFLDAKSLKMQI
jgi:hypothetical protein